MKKSITLFSLYSMVMIFVLVGCSDGGGNPTNPRIQNLDVAGKWLFSGSISSNSCSFLQDSSTFQIGSSALEIVNITQDGSNLTASHSSGDIFSTGDTFAGTLNDNAMQLAMSNPIVDGVGSCTYSLGGGMDVTVDSGNPDTGTGSVNLTLARASGSCTSLEPLPCTVTYSGNWFKSSASKLNSQESAEIVSEVDRLQEYLKKYVN